MYAIVSMIRNPKHKHYNAEALLVKGPIGLMGWVEGLTCDSFLIKIGGHFWYDMTIPMSLTAYILYLKHAKSRER